MEANQKLNVGVGTEEHVKLEAKPVKVMSLDIISKEFAGKPTDQLIMMVKHPDKEDQFPIYNVCYQKGNSIKTVGFTLYYDSTGKLLKGTAAAEILRIYGCKTLLELQGRELQTVIGAKGFLAIKAY